MNLAKAKEFAGDMLSQLNLLLPKKDRVVVEGFPNIEGSCIAVANYIHANFDLPVYFVINTRSKERPGSLLAPEIRLIEKQSAAYYRIYMSSKFIFLTHDTFLNSVPKSQVVVNIWHGVLYKLVRNYIGGKSIPASVTLGTSENTREMFAGAFGVKPGTVFISGYPRMDIMIKSADKRSALLNEMDPQLNNFDKIIFWLPTYRKVKHKTDQIDGLEAGNPFYITDFDVAHFNEILKQHNALCIIKPHPMAFRYENTNDLTNLMFIDELWLSKKNMTLYHLLGCSDMLISDVSSVIVDYMLLDKPIVCISEDFEAYKKTRGFYFEDIEPKIPTRVLKNQTDFFDHLQNLLTTGKDPYEEKRQKLKDFFFKYHDARNTERLVNHVFDKYSK